jgi:hypothetical protein
MSLRRKITKITKFGLMARTPANSTDKDKDKHSGNKAKSRDEIELVMKSNQNV